MDDRPSPASTPSVPDTQFRSHIEDLVKAPIDVIVDEHNHREFTPVALVLALVIPTRSGVTLSSYIFTTYNLPITPICNNTKDKTAQYYPENQSRSISTACEAIYHYRCAKCKFSMFSV